MRSWRNLFLVALAFGLPACSSFEHDWRQAGSADSKFAGRWHGRWTSAKHRNSGGDLRCILTPTGTNQYQAYFKAHWLLFSGTYRVPLKGREHGGTLFFAGTHTLPAVYGGVYRFEGSATRKQFSSTYDSSYDRGRFEMDRVGPPF
ncbi:MAG: hypothetical protein JWL59_1541 [Chthoniobacteraceae bacterium]|nr:hypothetical protein [Chthoniobacteraceae bacterium]